jgi:hypothetical protein
MTTRSTASKRYELRLELQDPFGPSFEQAPQRPAREFKLESQLGQRRSYAGA